jgi:hypothetical protein
MEKEWCSNCDEQGYSTSLKAKGVYDRERPHISESVRFPGTAAQSCVARLGCSLREYSTRLVHLSRIYSDCHCELVPLSGVFESLPQVKCPGSGFEQAVSRILSPRHLTIQQVAIISLGQRLPVVSCNQPEGETGEQPASMPRSGHTTPSAWSCSKWGLHSQPITRLLVSSYLTISPLPGVAAMPVIHAVA